MKNRLCLLAWILVAVSFAATGLAAETRKTMNNDFFVYFGTYTGPKSRGIYFSRFDAATGALSSAQLAAEAQNPAFLAPHPNGKYLYAIDEGSDPKRNAREGLGAFSIDHDTGKLTLLNQQTCGGPGPCHLSVEKDGQCVLVANYSGGSSALVTLLPDGRLGSLGTVIQHKGSSVNPARQKEPHAHGIHLSPDGNFALVPDLGLDQVLIYRLDRAKAALVASPSPFVRVAPGSGPRHLAFHPGGTFAYVINELLCTMTALRFNARDGELSEVQTLSTLPPGEALKKEYSTAEVVAHSNGKFLYGSNRGHNTIVVFNIDETTGKLTPVQHQSTLGKTPRNFAVDPTGAWLLAANQDSDSVAIFRIDPKTGRLTPHGVPVAVPSPVCVEFVAAPGR